MRIDRLLRRKKLYVISFISTILFLFLLFKKQSENTEFDGTFYDIYNVNNVINKKIVRSNKNDLICEEFSFQLLNKTKSNGFLSLIYDELKNLKKNFFYRNKKNCIYIVVGNSYELTRKKNFINIKAKKRIFYGINAYQINIVYNKSIIKQTFSIDEKYFKLFSHFRDTIVRKLLKKRLINFTNNFCEILNPETIERLVITLLMIRCVPIINKKWLVHLPLIDNDFDWSKAVIMLDDGVFFNSKYLNKHASLIYQKNEMIKYGKKLLIWNFKNLTPIVNNILTFIEKFSTGDVSEKSVKAINLYKEDEELFEIERYKQPVLNKFTVVFLTFQRNHLLNFSFALLNSVPNIDKIIIIWNNLESSYLPSKNLWCETVAPKFFIKTNVNSLNNKFLPFDIIKTEGVLTIDDDQFIRKKFLLQLFQLWKQNKDVIVGYYRRFVGNNYETAYITYCRKMYNVILTGLSFINKVSYEKIYNWVKIVLQKYLYYYTSKFPTTFKKKIDKRMNCEDIAINYLISFFSNKANIAFSNEGELSLIKLFNYTGLFLKPNHYEIRKYCTLELNRLFASNIIISNAFYMKKVAKKKKKLNVTSDYYNGTTITTTDI